MRLLSLTYMRSQKRVLRDLTLFRRKLFGIVETLAEVRSFLKSPMNFDFDFEIEESDSL